MATISVIALWDSVQTEQGGFTAGTVSVSIPGPNVVSSNTAVSGFTAYYLLRVSPDGTHVDHVDPATLGIGGTSPVLSVNGKSGAVVLTAADVGADASGAASTAVANHVAASDPHHQYALTASLGGAAYQSTSAFDTSGAATTAVANHVDAADPHTQYLKNATAASTYSPLVSPTLTGTPAAPTAAPGASTTQIATTQFVSIAISAIPAANITAGTFSGAYVFAAPPRLTVGPTSAPVVLRSSAYSDTVRPGDVLKYERGPTTGVVLVRDGINSFEFNPDNGFYNTTFNRMTLTTLSLSGVVAQMDGYAGIDGVTTGWHLTQYTGIYMCFGAKDYQGWGYSSTNTKRRLAGSVSTFIVNTDATYRGQRQHYAQDATGSRNTFREYTDGSRGYVTQTVQTTAPADADLNASEFAFYTDGTGLFAKLKNAASTVYTINLAGGGGGGPGTTFSGPINYPVATPGGWWVNPRDFGGYGDGVHDDTAAIVAALASANGDKVKLPAGDYLLSSSQITLPVGVSLEGTFNGTISHPGYRDGPPLPTGGGSRFVIGQTSVSPFRTNHDAYIKGFTFYDPTQTQTTAPVARPPAILVRGVNSGVISVELLNIYWGISIENTDGTSAGLTQRTKIWDVTGQPLYRGITMGLGNENAGGSYTGILDVPEIKFMFNPWWSYPQPGTPMAGSPDQFNWMLGNAVAVDVGDVDEAYFFNCFAFGYGIGARFQTFNRGAYGAWTNGGFDTCTRCVQVLGTNYPGIAFNGTSFGEPSGVTNGGIAVSGGVVLVNGGRFFNQNPAAVITGGATSLTGCNFGTAGGTHVIQTGGSINVVGGMAKGGLTTSGTVSTTGVMNY